MKLYRGTQRKALKGYEKITSWTPSKAVAVIYAARPLTNALGHIMGSSLQPTSTIHVGEMKKGAKVLNVCAAGAHLATSTNCSLWQVMQELDYGKPNGITDDEVLEFLEYLHNRKVGYIEAPRFAFVYFDEDGEPTGEEELELSLDPQSIIHEYAIQEYEDDPEDVAGRLVVDSFVYADSDVIRDAAVRLGYDVMRYDDVLAGAQVAAPQLFGCDALDVPGIEEGWEIYAEGDDDERIPANKTYRPLKRGVIKRVGTMPAAEVVGKIPCKPSAAPDANPRRPNPVRASNTDLVQQLRF